MLMYQGFDVYVPTMTFQDNIQIVTDSQSNIYRYLVNYLTIYLAPKLGTPVSTIFQLACSWQHLPSHLRLIYGRHNNLVSPLQYFSPVNIENFIKRWLASKQRLDSKMRYSICMVLLYFEIIGKELSLHTYHIHINSKLLKPRSSFFIFQHTCNIYAS